MWWLIRIASSLTFLTTIVLSIPLAFDVGGRACGLAYSLALSTFYFANSLLTLFAYDHGPGRRVLARLVSIAQWLVVPSLLLWSLNRFSVDGGNAGWVERTFGGHRAHDASIGEWLLGPDGVAEQWTLGVWDAVLRWSSPAFQLIEGFCSLLVIQAAGQITRWTVNRSRQSDAWMITFLVLSASVISSAVYFLWRIAQFPAINKVDAILIGVTITCAVILGAWGIGSGRGNAVESSLLFAYVVLCIYQIFTDYQPAHSQSPLPPPTSPDLPSLPPIIMASYSTIVAALSALPSMVHAAFSFVSAAFAAISPSVLVSLSYRLFVLYASTRIVPAVREAGAARALSQEATPEDTDGANRILGFVSWFAPSILIAVYTNLLMQHFAASTTAFATSSSLGTGGPHDPAGPSRDVWVAASTLSGNGWKWTNIIATMALYAVELYLGEEDIDGSLIRHWKSD